MEGLHRISVHTKYRKIQAEWLAIPSDVGYLVHAVLPAEVTKSIRHINNNKASSTSGECFLGGSCLQWFNYCIACDRYNKDVGRKKGLSLNNNNNNDNGRNGSFFTWLATS